MIDPLTSPPDQAEIAEELQLDAIIEYSIAIHKTSQLDLSPGPAHDIDELLRAKLSSLIAGAAINGSSLSDYVTPFSPAERADGNGTGDQEPAEVMEQAEELEKLEELEDPDTSVDQSTEDSDASGYASDGESDDSPPISIDQVLCPDCDNPCKNMHGLRVHQRRAHPEEDHEGLLEQRRDFFARHFIEYRNEQPEGSINEFVKRHPDYTYSQIYSDLRARDVHNYSPDITEKSEEPEEFGELDEEDHHEDSEEFDKQEDTEVSAERPIVYVDDERQEPTLPDDEVDPLSLSVDPLSLSDQVLSLLQYYHSGLLPSEIAKKLPGARTSGGVANSLLRLGNAGRIIQENGLYRLTDSEWDARADSLTVDDHILSRLKAGPVELDVLQSEINLDTDHDYYTIQSAMDYLQSHGLVRIYPSPRRLSVKCVKIGRADDIGTPALKLPTRLQRAYMIHLLDRDPSELDEIATVLAASELATV